MDKSFRPRSGRYGLECGYTFSEKISALTSAGTDTFRIPTPYRRCVVTRASVQAQVAPIITTGTATATLKKFRKSDGGTAILSNGLDLETIVANKGLVFTFLSTATDADLTIQEGDTLFVDVVNGTTIATAPTAMFFSVEFAVLE
jgi:hypothetical protein